MSGHIDDIVASSDPAMVVVTTATGDERSGCLVGFHSQCSIEPFRYAVWLSKVNHTYRVALAATHFAVHFLAEHDDALAELFGTETGDAVDKFAECSWTAGEGGVPLLDGCAAIVFGRDAVWDEGGDHACFVGAPVRSVGPQRLAPLRLVAVDHLTPGHAADEDRAQPATDADGREATDVDARRELAAGFGHELTADQLEAIAEEHEAAGDDT